MLCLKQIQLEDFLKLLGYRFLKISPLNSNQKPAFILILFYFILIYFIYFLFYLLFFWVFFGSAFSFFFFIYFYQLEANYFTILQQFLPYIDMNQPWIYMCSPSQSPLPPPSPSQSLLLIPYFLLLGTIFQILPKNLKLSLKALVRCSSHLICYNVAFQSNALSLYPVLLSSWD